MTLVPAILNLGLLVYLLAFLPKSRITNIFALFIMALLMWQAEDTLSRCLATEEQMRYFDGILSLGWIGQAPLLLHFVLRFSSDKPSTSTFPSNILLYLPFIVFYTIYVNNPAPVNFNHHPFWGWVATPRPNSLDLLQRYVIAAVIFYSVIHLLVLVFKSRGPHQRRKKYQALFLAVGITIPAIQGTLTQVVFPTYFDMEVPVTSSFMTFFTLSAIFAMSRFHLFEISQSVDVAGILENINNPVLIISHKGKIIYRNSFAQQHLALPQNIAAPRIQNLMPADERERFNESFLKPRLAGQQIENYELTLPGVGNQDVYLNISSELVMNNGYLQGVLLIAHDITERKKNLKAIQEQNEKLREIAHTQSHVVRAPLARILGIISLLQIPDQTDAEKSDLISKLKESGDELDDVVREIVKNTNNE